MNIPELSDEEIETVLGGPPLAEEPETAMPFGHDPKICHPVMDDEDSQRDEYARGYRAAGMLAVDHWKLVLVAMLQFKGDPRFAILCCAAAHGFWHLIPQRDQVEIAAHFGCERANVNKLVKLIQKRLGLPPTLGQRSVEGCDNMSEKRKSQLHQRQHDAGPNDQEGQ